MRKNQSTLDGKMSAAPFRKALIVHINQYDKLETEDILIIKRSARLYFVVDVVVFVRIILVLG